MTEGRFGQRRPRPRSPPVDSRSAGRLAGRRWPRWAPCADRPIATLATRECAKRSIRETRRGVPETGQPPPRASDRSDSRQRRSNRTKSSRLAESVLRGNHRTGDDVTSPGLRMTLCDSASLDTARSCCLSRPVTTLSGSASEEFHHEIWALACLQGM